MAAISTGFAESGHLPFGDYVLHVANFSSFVGRFEYSFIRQTATDITTQRGEEETISPNEEWWHKFSVNAPSTFFSLHMVSSDGIAVEIIQLASAVDLSLVRPAITLPDGNYILRVTNPSGVKARVSYTVRRACAADGEVLELTSPEQVLQAQSGLWRKFVVEHSSPALSFELSVASTGNTFEEVVRLGPILILDSFPLTSVGDAPSSGAFAFRDELGCFSYSPCKFSKLATQSQFEAYRERSFLSTGPADEFQLFSGPDVVPWVAWDANGGCAAAPDGGGVLRSLDDMKKFVHNPYVTANNYTCIALAGAPLSHEAVERLGEYLTSTLIIRRITSLVLAAAAVDDERLIRLLSGLSHVTNYLDLSENSITDTGVVALSALLATSEYNLQFLSLRANAIEDLGAAALSDALTRNATLLALDVSDNLIGVDGAKQLQQGIRINHSLRVVEAGGNPIGRELVDLLGRLAPVRLVDHVQWTWRNAVDARSGGGVAGAPPPLGAPLHVVSLAPGKMSAPTPVYVITFTGERPGASEAATQFVVLPRSELEAGTTSLAALLAAGSAARVFLPPGASASSAAGNGLSAVAFTTVEGGIVVYSGAALVRALKRAGDVPGGVVDVPPLVVIDATVVAPCAAASAQVLLPRFVSGGGSKGSRTGGSSSGSTSERLRRMEEEGAGGGAPWTVEQSKAGVGVVAFEWIPVLESVPCEAAVLYADGTPAIVSGGAVSALGCSMKRAPVSGVVAIAWGIGPMAQSHMTPRPVLAMGTADGRVVLQRPASAMLLASLEPPSELASLHAAAHIRYLGGDVWLVGFVARSGSFVWALVHLQAAKGGVIVPSWRVLGPQVFPVAAAAALRPPSRLTHTHVPVELFSELADAAACVKVSLALPFPRLLVLSSSISPDVEVLTSTPHSDPLYTWRTCALPNSTLFSPGPTKRASAASPGQTPVDFQDGTLAARCFPLSIASYVVNSGAHPLLGAGWAEGSGSGGGMGGRSRGGGSGGGGDGGDGGGEYEYEYEYDDGVGAAVMDLRRHAVYSRRRARPDAIARDEDASSYANLSTVESLHHLHLELPCVRVALLCVLLSGHVLEYEFAVRQEKPVDQGPIKGDTYDLFASYQVARKRDVATLPPPPSTPLVAAAGVKAGGRRSSPLDYVDATVGGLFDQLYLSRQSRPRN